MEWKTIDVKKLTDEQKAALAVIGAKPAEQEFADLPAELKLVAVMEANRALQTRLKSGVREAIVISANQACQVSFPKDKFGASWPVTLYRDQWAYVFKMREEIEKFLSETPEVKVYKDRPKKTKDDDGDE